MWRKKCTTKTCVGGGETEDKVGSKALVKKLFRESKREVDELGRMTAKYKKKFWKGARREMKSYV